MSARPVARARPSPLLALGVLLAGAVAACGDADHGQSTTPGGGERDAAATIALDGGAFNQCSVAAPGPMDTGQCTAVGAPLITNFDDYTGGPAASYTYEVSATPPASNVLGAIQHIGDGSDMDGGTSIIATDMITGVGGSGYALQISDTDATNWGGFLSFYFPSSGSALTCLNANGYQGVEFSIQGSSNSGNFGVTLRMLDTIPVAQSGLCDNADASDCKDATVQLPLPADATTWTTIQLPWSAFTPGVGSATSCVPVTGQNIVSLIIQPLMAYPPPNYTLQPGPYVIAVDNVELF